MRNLLNIFFSPDVTDPSAAPASTACRISSKVSIVIGSTQVKVAAIPVTSVSILICNCSHVIIVIAEISGPFSLNRLVAIWISKHVELFCHSSVRVFQFKSRNQRVSMPCFNTAVVCVDAVPVVFMVEPSGGGHQIVRLVCEVKAIENDLLSFLVLGIIIKNWSSCQSSEA